ncbi:peptidylprolyl isomerase [Dactylosporangium sp. AC04546]|uniref:peptidylprolyl isomerase n=1 Tax=Dactylosporangium sp. AC04546 TaxID=2862460 RepID=UPI001EDD95E0|nr:peptidylprolyl isomerase [Dactylosporangium sp. AC04546]WVK81701.1 peptidylprolyl isomerase [Dactylosporangium sp. AC04546]
MASSKARQRALARAKTERQIARRAAAARRRRQWQAGIGSAVALALIVLVVIWKTGGFEPEPVRASECAWTSVEAGSGIVDVGKPRTNDIVKNGVKTLTISLGQGTVTAKLDPSKAPCTVESLTYLASKKFFDNTTCHRLTDSILQCGDPSGSGSGGPAYRFPNENVPSPVVDPSASASADPSSTGNALYPAGTLAMAHSSEPDSNGSQFFLVFKDVQYPADYTIFGTIVGGLDVLAKIGEAGNDGSNQAGGGKPNQDVKISSLTVTDVAPEEPAASPSASTSGSPSTSASPAASASSQS